MNGASDKLDMVVVLDQPLPSNKAAPGAAERRVGSPQTIPIHSQACGSPALQRDGGDRGFTALEGWEQVLSWEESLLCPGTAALTALVAPSHNPKDNQGP